MRMRWAVPYDRADHCTSGPSRGGRALAAYVLERWGPLGIVSLGIYNCRTVRGGTSTSVHGEGRAFDAGCTPVKGQSNPVVLDIIGTLAAHGPEIGLQLAIHARVIYDYDSPAGRRYGGVAPHWDHAHLELTREAATTLTLARLRRVCGAPPEGGWRSAGRGKQIVDRTRLPASSPVGPTVDQESARHHRTAVRVIQSYLRIKVDGAWGAQTQAAVVAFQRRHRLVPDGVVGPRTWHALAGR